MLDWCKKPVVRLVGLGVLFSALLGCFEVREEITIHKNRSGTYRLVIDMGAMAGMMQDAGESLTGVLADGVSEKDPTPPERSGPEAEMDEDMLKKIEVLGGVEGISDVVALSEGGLGISFSFKNLNALDAALGLMDMGEDAESSPGESPFVFSRRTITRGPKVGLGFDSGAGSEPEGMMMMAAMEPTYTFKLTVPRKIRKLANEAGATLSIDRQTLTVTAPLAEMLSGDIDLTNEIRYR